LFIVLSLFTLYLFMMGYVSTSFLRTGGSLFAQVALTVSVGILINYCLMLTGQPITRVFAVGVLIALWGVRTFYVDLRNRPANTIDEFKAPVFSLCCIGYILIVYYLAIFSEPLLRWDARSIWFFQARMIWIEGALRQQSGWNHSSIEFSHPDYPKLVPTIAAQLAYLRGYWNEFIPKGSLFVMLVPLTLWVFSFWQKSVSFIFLVLTFFFSLGVAWLSNGLMDGYLALYAGVALLSFGRYLSERRDTDLYAGVCALGIAANIKNEGLLFDLCLITALLIIGAAYGEVSPTELARRVRTDSRLVRVLILSIAPTAMWTIYKNAWGLQNDLTEDPSAVWSRLLNRVSDGFSLRYVLGYLTTRATSIWVVIGLLAVTAIFSARQRFTLPRGAIVAATASALYVSGLYVVYLSSPNLTFHLFTSATRTMATASVAIFVSMFFLLSALEVKT
jgi:hypothetical protein